MSKKDKQIEELVLRNAFLEADYNELVQQFKDLKTSKRGQAPTIPTYTRPSLRSKIEAWWKKDSKYAADIAFDIWPIKDWFRLSYSPWHRGKYAQVCIGPFRGEFFQT